MVERFAYLFQVGVLYRRTFLALRAIVYLRHFKLIRAQLFLFYTYSLHRAFRSLDKDTNPYGETPFITLDKLARRFRILSKDRLYDLGCGRGLGLFWWTMQVGCTGVGIDNYASFITLARDLQERLGFRGVTFIEGDFLKIDLTEATVIYLYGTALSDEVILQLISRFEKLEPHVKIITVSYPLSDYSSSFRTEDQCRALLPWGRADFYLNIKI